MQMQLSSEVMSLVFYLTLHLLSHWLQLTSELSLTVLECPHLVRPQTLWQFWLKDLSIERVGVWLGQPGLTVGFLLLLYSVVCTVESLSFFLSPFYTSICMYYEMIHPSIRNLSWESNIYVSWSTSETNQVRLVPSTGSSIFFTGRSKAVLLLWILFVIYFCLVFCLFDTHTVLSVPNSLVVTC